MADRSFPLVALALGNHLMVGRSLPLAGPAPDTHLMAGPAPDTHLMVDPAPDTHLMGGLAQGSHRSADQMAADHSGHSTGQGCSHH